MGMKITPINIAFILPRSIIEAAVALSKKLSEKNDVHFTLDEKNHYTHISIYPTEIVDSPLKEVFSTIQRIANETKPFTTSYIGTNTGDRYLDFTMDKNESMQQLHENIIHKVNPFRKGYIREKYLKKEYQARKTKKALQYIKKYGRWFIMSLYRPHITFTRFKQEGVAEEVANTRVIPDDEFELDTIGIFKRGDHGTCNDLLESFKLKDAQN